MRIDSGMSGYLYQSRSQQVEIIKEEAPRADTAQVAAKSTPFMSAVSSSTLLSASLASALWAIDGGRKTASQSLQAQESDYPFTGDLDSELLPHIDQVSAHYMEFGDRYQDLM